MTKGLGSNILMIRIARDRPRFVRKWSGLKGPGSNIFGFEIISNLAYFNYGFSASAEKDKAARVKIKGAYQSCCSGR
jgi:hypothetical protein